MPIYEYRCESCGCEFELIQKISDDPAAACRDCGEGPVNKLISQTAFQLKGGGWYTDGYASKQGSSSSEPAEKKSSSSDSSSSKSKGESSSKSKSGTSASSSASAD